MSSTPHRILGAAASSLAGQRAQQTAQAAGTDEEGATQADAPREVAVSPLEPAPGIELVVGLGNPGERYAATRHNLGYLVVDELASRLRAAPWSHRPLCDVTSAPLGPRLLLARPLTFMNRSGAAAAWLLDHLGLDAPRLLVVLDDVDLDLGTLRLRRSGGPGTHNGLRDICERIGTGFPRLRLGVRGSGPWQNLADYVLSPFADDEQPLARQLVARAADAVETTVREGIDAAMGRFNGPAPVASDDR
ncbi:MAG TPA: aminoacyl-tRNA hydrolase [Thermoanaerobaculales bacterium]|nr:aminoacyl-tRNA hydrolase [Thermoanaerobaculales bacterium]HPA80981.1 aminoacyl-tRNA hydrolase [Thermoanaerobaculales bacterium]HQL30184.1 aminoacyl-tRNA hydrolase [Thermoanaerobaculales bacterium]HQN95328.1 aminoacyl-tRNA hydrolase [Thermoanaerobaculales bacterium]HQP44838.1 aminoacyl-tRNA hydrolase [Thermoanaerobaculales bacterium]